MDQLVDDLEAVRSIVATLEIFEMEERERIIRWVCEKLKINTTSPKSTNKIVDDHRSRSETQPTNGSNDIKTFIAAKDPKSEVHFATTVAYYYKFESDEAERKSFINSSDLQEACRRSGRNRLNDPGHTLRDAKRAGLLDKGKDRGTYRINAVGENLVVMSLPMANKQGGKHSQKFPKATDAKR